MISDHLTEILTKEIGELKPEHWPKCKQTKRRWISCRLKELVYCFQEPNQTGFPGQSVRKQNSINCPYLNCSAEPLDSWVQPLPRQIHTQHLIQPGKYFNLIRVAHSPFLIATAELKLIKLQSVSVDDLLLLLLLYSLPSKQTLKISLIAFIEGQKGVTRDND